MRKETHIDITNRPDLIQLAEAVCAANNPTVLSRGDVPLVVVNPVRKRRAIRRPSEADIEAFRAAAGGWKGVVDVERFKEDNRRQKLIATRPYVDL
jgi:hypothetical protein